MKNLTAIYENIFNSSFFSNSFLLFSCKEKVTNFEDGTTGFSYSASKCHGDLQKEGALPDSSFEYTFFDSLFIDFSLPGNCCPDSNRFLVFQNINQDTIYISVEDTAANLCLCICNYHIYAEFSDLPEDHYVVFCTLKGAEYNPVYLVDVYKMDGIFRNSAKRK
ncbi:MAG: hypothetical protein ACM34M_04630 [Ignavibacteria bacterium]